MRTPNFKRLSLTLLAVSAACATGISLASSHREAPFITTSPKVDNTDFYMFRSYEPGRQDYLTLIANYQPDQGPYGEPNYYTLDPDALYEFHLDTDGDAIENISFDEALREARELPLKTGLSDARIDAIPSL